MLVTSEPVAIEAGNEYLDWTRKLRRAVADLQNDGSIAPMAGYAEMTKLSDRIDAAVERALSEAQSRGEPKATVSIEFSDAEMRVLSTIGESMASYVEILTTRGKLDAAMSPGVLEAVTALRRILT
jgi:hypothetical protein